MEFWKEIAIAFELFLERLNADLMSADQWRCGNEAAEQALTCTFALMDLEDKGLKGSEGWVAQWLTFKAHERVFNAVQADVEAQKELLAQHNTLPWKVARWFRDWF